MLVASPVRAITGALFVSLLFAPRGEADGTRARASETHTLVTPTKIRGEPVGKAVGWAEPLEPLLIQCANTGAEARVRLYRKDGAIDPDATDTFIRTVSEADDALDINLRTMQLAIKAAYHFKAKTLIVVSGFRPGRGPHALGDAVDFKLPGVAAAPLAAYLRTLPRAGVGIYTHPRTQYVHLDDREQSFHWLDASPPGKTWREARLADPTRDKRDAAWTPEVDLPVEPVKRK